MVSVLRRMNVLKRKLYNIRHGPGAAQLPPEIARLHLQFPLNGHLGQLGPRKFWRQHLPSLKYHNPSVPMIVNRTVDPAQKTSPALLSIYLRTTSSTPARKTPASPAGLRSTTDGSSPAPAPLEGETVVSIDMSSMKCDAIMAELVAKTGARPAPAPTSHEEAEKAELEALEAQAEVDREIVRKFRIEEKKQKLALDKVKREAADMKAASQEL